MKFVYATDLHGDEEKYRKALDLCLRSGASLLHIGADLLPKGYSIQPRQKDFLKKFLPEFVKECQAKGVMVLGMMGNDDIWSRRELCEKALGHLQDRTVHQHEGMLFTGYPYVPDYPFSFKWACKLDSARDKPQSMFRGLVKYQSVECTDEGLEKILDPDAYFKGKGTIADDMAKLKVEPNTIMAFHCPPSGCGLDLCIDGRKVGSKSVRKWIRDNQPYMVLCGHLHESPWVSGKWRVKVGRTLVVQPGQYISAATIDPKKQETMSESDLDSNPWKNTSMLRAVLIEASPGSLPKVTLVDC